MGIYEELEERNLIKQMTNADVIKDLINNGKAIFYIGFDPTADSLHIGHFMTLVLMKRLQEAGNTPIVLLGGGTGYIGDPSGRSDLRNVLPKETIEHNINCFKNQIGKFIDFSKAIVVNNADWILKQNYIDFIREIGPHFSVNNMLRAECYKLRMEKGLSFLEFNYMLLQAFDFYYLFKNYNCNLQLGGDDQWSNMLAGKELIRRKEGKEVQAMTITLLLNSEGKKMGKTSSGAVWLDKNKTSPFDFFQYWRNIEDSQVINYFKLLTFVPVEEIKNIGRWGEDRINEQKERLAFELTKLVHGEEEANKALTTAKNLFSNNLDSEHMPHEKIICDNDINILDLMVKAKLASSKSEARRLVIQGGVSINNEKVNDPNLMIKHENLEKGVVLKKGKKTFVKVTL